MRTALRTLSADLLWSADPRLGQVTRLHLNPEISPPCSWWGADSEALGPGISEKVGVSKDPDAQLMTETARVSQGSSLLGSLMVASGGLSVLLGAAKKAFA